MRQLLNNGLVLVAAGAAAAAQTVITGTTIDTQGYQDVTVIAHLGAITATGTATLKVAQGNAADGSDKADLAGSAVASNDTQSNKALAVGIHRPTKRYITPILTRATANSALVLLEVILSSPSQVPVTQTYIVVRKELNGPDEGSAT